MRIATFAAAALFAAVATTALAQDAAPAAAPAAATKAPEGSTIANVIAKGVTMSVGGMEFEINYNPNGTFDGGAFAGRYRVDGDKLCLDIEGAGESCTAYPAGKKSGDSFEIQSDFGPIMVKIK